MHPMFVGLFQPSSVWLRASLTHNRRRWERRIAAALHEKREEEIDSAAQRFERVYRRRQFTPIEEAFPTMQPVYGSQNSLSSFDDKTSISVAKSELASEPHVLKAAVLGPHNAGKTSLINALGLSHIGAVSHRFGSTQDWIKAVTTVHQTQLHLLDTPGVVVMRSEKDRRRHAAAALRAWEALFVVDLVVLTLPVGLGFVEDEHKRVAREVVHRAAARQLPVILVLTMMDKIQTPRHRELYFAMRADLESMALPFAMTHEVSVKGGSGLVDLKDCFCQYAKPGVWEHDRYEVTDLAPPDRVAELLRQVYLEVLPHEIPHVMRQRIIGWTCQDSATTEVVIEVFFDRPAYMFTFYAKLEAICLRAQQLVEFELRSSYRFVFQAFIAPGGMA